MTADGSTRSVDGSAPTCYRLKIANDNEFVLYVANNENKAFSFTRVPGWRTGQASVSVCAASFNHL